MNSLPLVQLDSSGNVYGMDAIIGDPEIAFGTPEPQSTSGNWPWWIIIVFVILLILGIIAWKHFH